MKLTNTIITITVTVPTIELESDLSLTSARTILHDCALEYLDGRTVISSEHPSHIRILDCPSYPALNE